MTANPHERPPTPTPPTGSQGAAVREEPTISITSFGYLHGNPPAAHLTLDLREHFRDPHINPRLRDLTANHPEVRHTVLNTPGIRRLMEATTNVVRAYQTGPNPSPITIAIGCAGGRHRAATVATELGTLLGATVTHRDLAQPVINR